MTKPLTAWDPARLEVAWQRLISIADEMAAALRRTAFSSIVREANDYACALLTRKGELLAEYSRSVPVFTGVLSGIARSILPTLESELRPGDVVVTNDPWVGNTHLADFTVLTPIFVGGRELAAYSASICHVSDIGGVSEGAFASDVFEEGLCLPPMKLREAGRVNEGLFRIIARNVRVPELVLGDLHALIAANDLGARRFEELFGCSSSDELPTLIESIASASESAMRTAIRALPDGVYSSAVDLDGFEEAKTIRASIQVADDELVIDFEGTSPQSRFGINAASPSSAYALYSLKCILSPALPNNSWTYLPIEVRIPPGTLLNPTPPAAVSANFPAHLIQAVLYLALYEAAPHAVMAPSGAPMWVVSIRGRRGTEPFASVLCFNGGQGGLPGRDGRACLSMPSNVGNTPIETVEAEVPIVFEKKAIARGTGGLGRWRGGDGQEVSLRSAHDDDLDIIFLTERLNHPAPGIGGGLPGAVGEVLVDGAPVGAPKGRMRLAPGSRVFIRTPGGGGYGPPDESGGGVSGH